MASKKILYGGETQKAVDNFPISGETVPPSVIHWLGRIKGAAARANAELERLDPTLAESIAQAADAVGRGDHDGQFPIDVFQTGSGTSSNMNANEVIASLAGKAVHPNDHVNMGQSSNDVFPSAVHLAALDEATNTLLPALKQLERSLTKKAKRFENVVKAGRTHLMDAVPVTLGQEFAGYAAQIRLGQERIEAALVHVRQIPLGGTATGTGLNTHPQFAEKVRKLLSKETRLKIDAPADPFEAQGNRDALVELSGALKVVAVSLTKIAQDIALMGSGPRAGVGELYLPELQKGSSIMPGKVNPVIPEVVLQVSAQVIGNDTAVTIGGMQGQFELNVRVPLMARNVLQSIHLLSTASVAFAEKVIDGVAVNKEGTERSAAATLAVATALNEHIGYDKATTIVKKAADSGRMLRDVAIEEGVDPELYDRVIDLRRIAAGSQADQQERPAPKPKPKPKPKPAAAAASSNGRKRGQRAPA
ncbi:MAG: fumarate hydratase, class [Solirubrobacteraceae bacterium]|nr:fumarate hydratase, class [Solirubrobacteraceae bacterium]